VLYLHLDERFQELLEPTVLKIVKPLLGLLLIKLLSQERSRRFLAGTTLFDRIEVGIWDWENS
jgi:hypothetical protein